MSTGLAVVIVVVFALLWLYPVALLMHEATVPGRPGWPFVAAAVAWFFLGLYLAAKAVG